MPCRSTIPVAVLAAFVLAFGPVAHAQSLEASEPQVKAAFVLNFAKFVTWPAPAFASPQAPLIVCSTARDAFAAALSALDGRVVQGHEVKVRRHARGDDPKGCHVLVVAGAEENRGADWIRLTAGQPTLTVGDGEGFAEAGGIIGLVNAGNRIQFDINSAAAQRNGLTLSSQLLRLARNIRGERG